MDENAGVLRSADSRERAASRLAAQADAPGARPCTEDWETTNIHGVASLLVHHARLREETRGSHWREDFPERDDAHWRVRLVSSIGPDGSVRTRTEPVEGAQ